MKCYILDDHHGRSLYLKMKELLPDWIFPVQENCLDPLEYLPHITNEDIVLLDNFFPTPSQGYAPLGEVFLYNLLASPIEPKIIGISSIGKKLVERYEYWNHAYKRGIVVDFVASKSAHEIIYSLKSSSLLP